MNDASSATNSDVQKREAVFPYKFSTTLSDASAKCTVSNIINSQWFKGSTFPRFQT